MLFTLFEFIGVRCASHTLQLAMIDTLKSNVYHTAIAKRRFLANKLRTPSICSLLNQQCLLRPVVDCPTRWNSTFHMLESLNKAELK